MEEGLAEHGKELSACLAKRKFQRKSSSRARVPVLEVSTERVSALWLVCQHHSYVTSAQQVMGFLRYGVTIGRGLVWYMIEFRDVDQKSEIRFSVLKLKIGLKSVFNECETNLY